MAIGDYPIEYDPAKHGVYDPAKYYGTPDTPLSEVKLGELGAWVSRRNKGIRPLVQLCSRAYWRWQHKYVQPRRAGVAAFLQYAVASSVLFYVLNYKRIRGHRSYDYH